MVELAIVDEFEIDDTHFLGGVIDPVGDNQIVDQLHIIGATAFVGIDEVAFLVWAFRQRI